MSNEKRSSYLTIRFEGPEVRPGRMRLDDFIQAAQGFSAWAKQMARKHNRISGGVSQ